MLVPSKIHFQLVNVFFWVVSPLLDLYFSTTEFLDKRNSMPLLVNFPQGHDVPNSWPKLRISALRDSYSPKYVRFNKDLSEPR